MKELTSWRNVGVRPVRTEGWFSMSQLFLGTLKVMVGGYIRIRGAGFKGAKGARTGPIPLTGSLRRPFYK